MPYSFDFDLKEGILRCCLSGQVTDEMLHEFFRAGAGHAARTRPNAGIVDLSNVESFDVSVPAIERLAKTPPVLRDPDLSRIIIAPSSQVYGMMRMFEIEGEATRPGIHVVRSEGEAWAILAVAEPTFLDLL
jgi:hypothetical protein